MKNIVFFICLLAIVLTFNACAPGYVSEEPIYLESARPARPSVNHVWVDGNWDYSRRSHAYTHRDGYYAIPNRGRSYQPGKWESNKQGHRWKSGQWK